MGATAQHPKRVLRSGNTATQPENEMLETITVPTAVTGQVVVITRRRNLQGPIGGYRIVSEVVGEYLQWQGGTLGARLYALWGSRSVYALARIASQLGMAPEKAGGLAASEVRSGRRVYDDRNIGQSTTWRTLQEVTVVRDGLAVFLEF